MVRKATVKTVTQQRQAMIQMGVLLLMVDVSTNSNETSTYAPGMQRVAQSSTWYKPKKFTIKSTNSHSNGHSIEPPKPLPRHSKIGK